MIKARISAIITAYNSEAFIADALNSILKQSRAVDEIVVVDDGSTDGTRHVVAEFVDRGVQYVHQQNSGLVAARNRGIWETSGEFIAFLDSDDVWLEDKTRLQFNYLIEHPDVALVSGFARWWNVAKDIVRISGKEPRDMHALRRELLIHNVLGNASMMMIRRAALEDVGLFNKKVRWGEDWELWLRLVEHYDVAVIPEPLMVYRWHKNNYSNLRRWEKLLGEWHVSRNAILRSTPAIYRPWLMARSWSNFTYRRAMYAFQAGFPRWRQIWYSLLALLVYPFEMPREKLGAVVHAIFGDQIYQIGKRVLRSRMQVRGQE